MNYPDILSNVFSTLRLKSNFYFTAELKENYAIKVPVQNRVIRFHLVKEGQCYIQIPGLEPTFAQKGNLIIIPNGESQVISSTPGVQEQTLDDILSKGCLDNGHLKYGEGADTVKLLCGYLEFDEAADHPVIKSFPRMIMLSPDMLENEPWTAGTLDLLLMEAEYDQLGVSGILSRLLEVIFIQIVRKEADNASTSQEGFIAALLDSRLSVALHAIHDQPHAMWTIEGLSKTAGMSRARFAKHFKDLVGIPPMTYLTNWRLMKARRLLQDTDLDLESIASRCGYSSSISFSRRFKEAFKIGPSVYRKI